MRRASAALLLTVLLTGSLAPVARAGVPGAGAPMCCRRGGQHHCMTPGDDGVRAPRAACPFCPQTLPARAARPQAPVLAGAPLAEVAAVSGHRDQTPALPELRSASSRAPPIASSL